MKETRALRITGSLALLVLLAVVGAAVAICVDAAALPEAEGSPRIAGTIAVAVVLFILLAPASRSSTRTRPGSSSSSAVTSGRSRKAGFHWTVPLTTKRRVSLRVRNFETARLKVSDADGNPVEIAAVVVYRVVDSAKAAFAVDDHVQYVAVQAETAVRHLATSYPYESHETGRHQPARRRSVVSQELTTELRDRVALAGVEVLETRITHLAYAPEIAQAMLARQQANAIVAARSKIVEGAVGMVQHRAGPAARAGRRRARRGAQGADGLQPAGRALRRPGHPADGQHRHACTEPTWPSARRSCCASTRPSTTRSPSGRPTTCAASTPRSSTPCGAPCTPPGGACSPAPTSPRPTRGPRR